MEDYPKNEDLIEEFKTIKEVEEGLAFSTIKEYSYDLGLFFKFMNDKHASKINTSDIRKFLSYLSKERNYSKKALARKISTLRSFFNFLFDEKYINIDPMSKIKSPKLDKTLPIYPTEEEAKKLVETIKNDGSKYAIRDLAIITTFLYTGMRVEGVHNLNVRDIDFKSKTLRVREKGGKTRIVHISDVGLETIKNYLDIRPEVEGEEALFISRHKKRLAIRTIQHIITKYKEKAEINPKISCHKLRHFFATMALARNMDIRLIQKQLGHAQLSTTQKYTHVVDELLSREYNKAFNKWDLGVAEEEEE